MSLAPMSVWTCRKCCWLLLTVLCVSKEMRPMKLLQFGFQGGGACSMLPVRGGHVSVFCLIPLFSFNFHCNVPPPGVIRMNFEL